mgnify:CR=1 FL=1
MKIIVFGIGGVYSKVKPYFDKKKAEITALVDNSRKLFGTLVDGHMVDLPEHIQNYKYDYVIITSNHDVEMRRQLIGLGIVPDQIIHYRDYMGSLPAEVPAVQTNISALGVLILSNDFGYHGGPIACMKLAHILKQKGYRVTIAVPRAEQEFLDETYSKEGIEVAVIKDLDFLSRENLEWTDEYAFVFANTFVMTRCAIKLAQKRRVYLWLHESVDSYAGYEYWYEEIVNGLANNQLIIGAVSDVARKNFLSIYHVEKNIGLFPYGIEDRFKENDSRAENGTTTFTVVANHVSLKGLDVLLDALQFVSAETGNQCRYLFVGKTYDSEYGRMVRNRIDKNAGCEYLGELSREKLFKVYSETDIVIIPSRRDSLPLVATEAMMLKKPCIISDSIGTARYIRHRYNGLVFRNEDRKELAELICWCLMNRDALKIIAENARRTYERWFTMEKFGDRVMDAVEMLKTADKEI